MAAGPTTRFLIVNGIPLTAGKEIPSVSSLLETTSGAYTTTRTHNGASSVLFLDRHLSRLSESARILAETRPDLFGSAHRRYSFPPASAVRRSVQISLRVGLRLAVTESCLTGSGDEIAITALVRGSENSDQEIDVCLHLGFYAPLVFGSGGAHLAVAGRGRDVATAKYSDWARVRKGLERMRPPSVTELLLSNDGDHILEGSLTNFFVVCRKVVNDPSDQSFHDSAITFLYEVQTTPIGNGVLPGVVRQLVIEACTSLGIPLREVAPSWSDRDLWEEAFVTSSLRILQHVEKIQAPTSCEDLHLKTWQEVSWVVKQFEGAGIITTQIQKEIMSRAETQGCRLGNLI